MPFATWRKFQVGIGKGRAGMVGYQKFNITPVGNVLTGEDDLQTVTMEGKSFYTNGQLWRITVRGRTGATAASKVIKFYVGAVEVFTMTGTDNAKAWWIDGYIWRTGAATQIATFRGAMDATLKAAVRTALTFAEASDIVLKATGTATNTDDILCDIIAVEALTR